MPGKEKEPEKPKEEEKKVAPCEEEKPKEKEKADAAPQWALELGAKIDKLADAIIRTATPIPEKKADSYPPPEEEKPKEEKAEPEKYPYKEGEKKKEPEKYPPEEKAKPEKYPYSEEKLQSMIVDAIKGAVGPEVEKAIAKRLTEEPIEKRAKVPEKGKEGEVDISIEALHKKTWAEVEELAKKI